MKTFKHTNPDSAIWCLAGPGVLVGAADEHNYAACLRRSPDGDLEILILYNSEYAFEYAFE